MNTDRMFHPFQYIKNVYRKIFFYLRAQFLFIIALVALFFCVGISIIVYSYNHVITKKINELSKSYVSTVSSSLGILESNTKQTAALLKNSSVIQEALSARTYNTTLLYHYNQQIRSQIVNVLHANDTINMIYIGNSNYSCQFEINSSFMYTDLTYAGLSQYLDSLSSPEQYSGVWLTGSSLGLADQSESLFYVEKIRNLNTLKDIGYIIMEVDSYFLNEASNHEYFDTGITFSFFKDNILLYQNGNLDPGILKSLVSDIPTDAEKKDVFYPVEIDHTRYYLTVNKIPTLSMDVISLISQDFLKGDVTHLYYIVVAVLIIFLAAVTLFSFRFSGNIVAQVSLIKNIFSVNQDTGEPLHHQPFQDNEIGRIGSDCEALLEKYNRSVRHTYELAIKQKETDLLRLQEQINPHFLYNTLNSIYWMCESNGNHDAALMALYLSRYFRTNLRSPEIITTTIRSDLESIKNYLAIQNLRYNNKFCFEAELEHRFLDYQIMRMLLQPIIENAIFHGLEPKNGPGTITLSVTENDNYLTIRISDDGVGFDEANLIKGLALKNIDERIKLFYGESCGMKINSKPGIGTTVSLYLLKEVKTCTDYTS